jgi:trimethylamine:corrinoid methyltransferase-like protein
MMMQQPQLYFKPKLRVISDDQIKQIHLAALEVLERTGIKMTHPRGLEVFDGAGARVDGDRVRIPGWLVEGAIRKAPSRVVLGNRNGKRAVILEGDTMKHFREVRYSRLFDRMVYDQWKEMGGKRFEERLRELTQEAMAHRPAPLPEDVIKELDRMQAHWA